VTNGFSISDSQNQSSQASDSADLAELTRMLTEALNSAENFSAECEELRQKNIQLAGELKKTKITTYQVEKAFEKEKNITSKLQAELRRFEVSAGVSDQSTTIHRSKTSVND
jgi:hypothetical protein